MKFGDKRAIEYQFVQREKNWSCMKNAQETARQQETERQSAQDEDEDKPPPEEIKANRDAAVE